MSQCFFIPVIPGNERLLFHGVGPFWGMQNGRALQELQLGFKGELTMSENMEDMAQCLYSEKLPTWWVKLGFASTRPLKSWRVNLQERYTQLDEWINDPLNIPKVVDISKLFNPQSYLTAIKQICCQNQGLELDKLQVFTEVTKKEPKQIDSTCKDGAYVSGMYLEGARWDMTSNSLEDSKPKDMFTAMPVITCKAGHFGLLLPPNSHLVFSFSPIVHSTDLF